MKRRDFINHSVLWTAALAATAYPASRRSFALEEVTLAEMQAAMRAGEYGSAELVRNYLKRIQEVDREGPKLNSVLELNPEAETIAAKADAERRAGRDYGPLHGIPILIKDNIDTADKMATTAGSLAMVGAKPAKDSTVAAKLRAAGAVILGKTNLSEWANFRSTRSTSGWSGRGGLTRNPYALDRNTSGSSSGSGAAAAANLCAAAIGSETDGSIVSPSSINGIVGIKPTLGLVSRAGVIPIAHSQDTAGPMARTVADAAILLGALTGVDAADAATKSSAGKSFTDYSKFLDANGLKGARLGVARKFFGFHPGVDKLCEDALKLMKERGAIIVDPADADGMWQFGDAEMEVLLYEFKADLNAYLRGLGPAAPVKTLDEIIAFNERNAEREMQHFGQELFLRAAKKGPLTDKTYLAARAKCLLVARAQGIDAMTAKHKLDAIVAPTDSPAWKTDLVLGDHYVGGSSTPAAVAGYPAVTVPAGFVSGLPVGISFFGKAFTEPTLIKLAYAYEQASKHRRPPDYAPSIG
jgi:amidase